MNLSLAPGLSLPLKSAVAQKYAWIGRSGSGKSYCAGKMVELIHGAGGQVVIMDPVGIWYGLRLAANGKDPGISIPILGGSHGDIPLEPSSGIVVADLIVDKRTSMVLDVSGFTGGEKERFIMDFAKHLFERKKKDISPMLLIWEEAQEFVPQQVFKNEARMVGAVERIAKIGRNFGIGTGLISQRPQEINKKVLNQTEVLFVYQTTGPQERKAIEGWVVEHALNLSKVVEELPSLPAGTGYVWSPQWLGIFKKMRCNPKQTYDASATPEFDGKTRKKVDLAPIDLKKLEESMKATIEKAKAEDPKELRKRIAELDAELKKARSVVPEVEIKEVPVFTDGEREVIASIAKGLAQYSENLKKADDRIQSFRNNLEDLLKTRQVNIKPVMPPPRPSRSFIPTLPSKTGMTNLPSGERKILTVLAHYPEGRTKTQVAILAGYSSKGGAFNNYLSALRTRNCIEGAGTFLKITHDGQEAVGAYEPLPTGPELLNYWYGQLGRAEREILRVLAEAYPNSLDKETLAAQAGYMAKGGGFNNALSRLRTLELIQGRGELQAAKELF